MSLYKQYATDPKLEREGVVLEYGPNSKGKLIGIRIARAGGGNQQFQKRAEAIFKPYRRQIQTEVIAPETVQSLMRQVYAETVVLGWENMEDADDNAMPFSVANCVKLFTDLPDLFTDVQDAATKSALFRQQTLEADSGN